MKTKQIVKVTDVRVGDLIEGCEVTRIEMCQAWYEKGCIRFHFGSSGSIRRGIKEPLGIDQIQTIWVER